MGIYLNPGNESFKRALRSEIYVDKTGLIACTNRVIGTEQANVCVSRPRRFGKSMAANMLCAYYSKDCDSKSMFSGKSIEKEPSFEQHLNQYDVIFLNIQQFVSNGGESGFTRHIEEAVLQELFEVYGHECSDLDRGLPYVLENIYRKKDAGAKGFVFIIDEWDCIFRVAKDNIQLQEEYLDFLRNLLKDRVYVQLAYMTGILPIKKYGTHSALNMFTEYSMTAAGRFAEYTGFTRDEVAQLCERYHMDFDEACRWYDGYSFEMAHHIFNPKAVVDAMLNEKYRSYWVNTETYEALQIYIQLDMDGLRDTIISMLGGNSCAVDIGSFQNDMTTFRTRDDVLTLLVHLGYLAYDEDRSVVFIPNEEVRGEFIRAIRNGDRPELVKAIVASDELMEATLQMNGKRVAELIENVHSANTSPEFYNNEQALRSVIKLAYYSCKDDYFTIHELPGGTGYADIVFIPRQGVKKPAIIVELKWDKSDIGAINQIKTKQYVQAIENYGGEILLVGINYDKRTKKHQCIIESYIKN